jgi:hypothetical protein
MTDDAPASSCSAIAPRPRRTALLFAACSLLAVGIGLNVHRHARLVDRESIGEDSLTSVEHFVAYMHQPVDEPDEPAAPERAKQAGDQGQRHRGEEGRMGKPSAKSKSGLYAMKGPSDSVPQMARSFDPEQAARSAGILGHMQQESGYFLASPYGGAFAVGHDDSDVWGGLAGMEIGEPFASGEPGAGGFLSPLPPPRAVERRGLRGVGRPRVHRGGR